MRPRVQQGSALSVERAFVVHLRTQFTSLEGLLAFVAGTVALPRPAPAELRVPTTKSRARSRQKGEHR
jgi:hypothetical protein